MIASHINVAFAQLALEGAVPLPNPQTNNIMNPTIGIAVKNSVNIHSPSDTSRPVVPSDG